MRRKGLAGPGDVVLLALDGEQRRRLDGRGADRPLSAPDHLAARQIVALEDAGDGLQVVLGGQVHHRQVVVVEAPHDLRALFVAREEVAVQAAVGIGVAADVERDERGELQETRIDLAQEARLAGRDALDGRHLEPAQRAGGRDAVDLRRVLARVDGPGHERHAPRRRGIPILGEERDGREDRNARLAHRDDMHVGSQGLQEPPHEIDVVVQIEPARRERDEAGIDPVGEVEVVIGQEPLDGVAQERCVVARERSDHQHLRVAAARVALEVDQIAERRAQADHFPHRDGTAVDPGRLEPEGRLRVAARRPLEKLARRRDRPAEKRSRSGEGGVRPEGLHRRGPRVDRSNHRAAEAVGTVHGETLAQNCARRAFVAQDCRVAAVLLGLRRGRLSKSRRICR